MAKDFTISLQGLQDIAKQLDNNIDDTQEYPYDWEFDRDDKGNITPQSVAALIEDCICRNLEYDFDINIGQWVSY